MSLVPPAALPYCLCLAVLVAAGLGAPLAAAASDLLQLRPMKAAATGEAARQAKPVADAPSVAASAAQSANGLPVDPIEQLRQRLATRLTASQISEAGGPRDLRVAARSASEGRAAPARPAAARRPSGDAAAEKGAPAQWSYQGPAGPQTWGGLQPQFALCGSGQRQSPIDIRGGLAVDLDPVKFNYQASAFGVVDNGYTVQANVAAGNSIEVGGKRFELVQLHFHRPSEERIDGRQFEMSVHLVHRDDNGRLAVVAVLMDKGPPQPAVQKVWNNLPLERNEEHTARVPLDLAELLPDDRRYFTYMGSLTTPPCSEGVQWVVMRQPLTMSAEQIELFARIYPMNARPPQQAAGRRILQSQ